MPPTMRKHGDDTYSSFFKIVYTAQIATVLAGCNSSVDSLLCSSDEGIRYPPDIFSASIFVPFPLSLRFPNRFRVSMIQRVSLVLHRQCSFFLLLEFRFQLPRLPSSNELCRSVPSFLIPTCDQSLHCMHFLHIHKGFDEGTGHRLKYSEDKMLSRVAHFKH